MKTLLQIVQEFCKRQGIPSPASVVTSTDDQVVQILGLMNEGLDELVVKKWPQQEVEATFSSTAFENQGEMENIAPGFESMIPKTFWNLSTGIQVNGSISPEDTQRLKALSNSSAFTNFRQVGTQLHFIPVVAAGLLFRFEYRTRYLVRGADNVLKQYFTADTDTTLLPDVLHLLDLRWRWRQEKGLSYAENMATFEAVKKSAFSAGAAKPNLSMTGANSGPSPGIIVPAGSWNQ